MPLVRNFFGSTGYVNGGYVAIDGAQEAQYAFVQVVAWDGTRGSTFETCAAQGGAVGKSNVIRIYLGGNNMPSPIVPAALVGLQPFVVSVPEPGVAALAALALPALAWVRAPCRRCRTA
jgi:hypothetical protein